MSNRRDFLKKAGAIAGSLSFAAIVDPLLAEEMASQKDAVNRLPFEDSLTDDDFWNWVRESYTVSSTIINLNNGGVSPQPKVVQDAHIRYYQYCNEAPSYFMWRILDQGRESLRMRLADLAGCDAEEIAVNRNATEGLNTIIFGLNLKAGDEVIVTKQDYPNMLNAWKQREKRDGIKLVFLDFELPQEDDAYFVKAFRDAMTPRTKIVHITQMINWTGQLLPTRKIADVAHAHGCEVIVDGAHTFAHVDFKIPDLGADYFATSLHKWLCAPFGSGMMYIRKEKIPGVWALLSNDKPDGDNIRKFESLGTRSFASEMAIGSAIDFHETIGSKRKEERLRFLKNYWIEKVRHLSNVKINTSLKAPYSCAIGNFAIEGWKPEEIDGQLFAQYKIHTVGINWENIHGVRVTPHVYTSLKELDRLAIAIEKLAGEKK